MCQNERCMVKEGVRKCIKKSNRIICMELMLCMTSAMVLGGCGQKSENSGKIEIELVQYKPEAVKTFEKIEEEFNATHDDIHLTIDLQMMQ